ncbi:immunoglobulin-like domain-containing protein [Anaerolentibacter hominis]|uniref:immunoglobulin-like domain-containing protein n=1 Tax=Anaerolentibacter hominis TaxID=3079009 RepID=UPI0031B89FB0
MRKISLMMIFTLLLILTACSKAEKPSEEQSLDETRLYQFQTKLNQMAASYEKEHPLDVSWPTVYMADEYEYPCFFEYEYAYGIISKNIAFQKVAWDTGLACYVLPVYGLDEEKERFITSELLQDDLFRSGDFRLTDTDGEFDVAAGTYLRDPLPDAFLEFYDKLRAYEAEYPGAVQLSWNVLQIRTNRFDMEREIQMALICERGQYRYHISILSVQGRQWLEKNFFPEGLPEYFYIMEEGVITPMNELIPDRLQPADQNSTGINIPALKQKLQPEPTSDSFSVRDERITFCCHNDTGREVYYDDEMGFEFFYKGRWYSVPKLYSNITYERFAVFTHIPFPADTSRAFALNLSGYAPLVPGRYRVIQRYYIQTDDPEKYQEKALEVIIR